MGPKMCVLVALNLVVLFALVSGCDKCPGPIPSPKPPSSMGTSSCPRDALKFAVCSGIVNGWNFSMGLPPKEHCCAAIEGLVDFEVAVCLCTAIKANILGFNLNIPISFTRLLNTCSKSVPDNFICH